MKYVVGIDIGGTKCAVVLGIDQENGVLDLIEKEVFPTGSRPYREVLEQFFSVLEALLRKHNLTNDQVKAIGISCGGPLDSKKGVVMSPPNLPGWDNVPVVELFENRFGIKSGIQNDANACALAEWKFGAGQGARNVIFLTFGTGMGSGLILDGRLYCGTNDNAGEVGHIGMRPFGPVGYGKGGSFEGFCSGGGIAQLAKSKALELLQMGQAPAYCPSAEQLDIITAYSVAMAAREGDPTAKEVFEISGSILGEGLSILMDILNPEVIVIGSIFARAQDLLWPSAEKIIGRQALSHARAVCKVVPAQLGENIGDYAALSVAVYTASS